MIEYVCACIFMCLRMCVRVRLCVCFCSCAFVCVLVYLWPKHFFVDFQINFEHFTPARAVHSVSPTDSCKSSSQCQSDCHIESICLVSGKGHSRQCQCTLRQNKMRLEPIRN